MTIDQLNALRQAWEMTDKTLRFGQYVVAHAFSEFPTSVPHIFYATDPDKAYALIVEFMAAK